MKLALKNLPDDPQLLKAKIVELTKSLCNKDELLAQTQRSLQQQDKQVHYQKTRIEQLEEQLQSLQRHRFGRRSEKQVDQFELQLFNEAELIVDSEPEASTDEVEVPAHRRRKAKPRALPKDLPKVERIYALSESERQCSCGQCMQEIGREVTQQLAIVPQQYYIIEHVRLKYACACKNGIRVASMPKQPIPKSQASALLLAYIMVCKFLDGLPLYRQEKISQRNGFDLPRTKTARWLIQCKSVFQPLYNLLQEVFFSYDIALSDDTGIQVLKEDGRSAASKSYLWIRRGGPPDKPVVLVDYAPSRSGETAQGLLTDFKGYLVADAYSGYQPAIRANGLKLVACNDHSRRKYVEVIENTKKQATKKSKAFRPWVALKAIKYYKALYKIEQDIAALTPEQKYALRQEKSVPIWNEFHAWLLQVKAEGVLHSGTRAALDYTLGHWDALTRYCEDGRLPISNIQSEHVAKTIALARKNFMFSDTPAGAHASAMIYSMLETAKANQLHPHQYLTVLLTELPNATCVEDVEALLPWNFTPESLSAQFHSYPHL